MKTLKEKQEKLLTKYNNDIKDIERRSLLAFHCVDCERHWWLVKQKTELLVRMKN